jgi:predicted Fe-S protein YdhL (DUF1289 family)
MMSTDTPPSRASPLPQGFVLTGILMSSTKDPCISVCKFTADICLGCGRSKREIRVWKKLDKTDKLTILAEASLRLTKLGATGRRKNK